MNNSFDGKSAEKLDPYCIDYAKNYHSGSLPVNVGACNYQSNPNPI